MSGARVSRWSLVAVLIAPLTVALTLVARRGGGLGAFIVHWHVALELMLAVLAAATLIAAVWGGTLAWRRARG